MSFVAILASLVLQQTPATAPSSDCLDDNHRNLCRADEQARVRALLTVRPIEDEAAEGAEVYRAFFVDGYGRDMPAVAFERRPDNSPEAVVYGRDGASIRAAVQPAVWNRVRAESTFADRELVQPLPAELPAGRPPPPPAMCLHAWVQTVEMANTNPERYRIEPIRRRTEDACEGALTTTFAFFLASEAVKAIAPCEAVGDAGQRSAVTILETCLALAGDRLSAADLRKARPTGGPRQGLDLSDPLVWKAWMGINGQPTLNWSGQVVRSARLHDRTVAEFIVARRQAMPDLNFTPQRFRGVTGREAVIEGQATWSDAGSRRVADYSQTWIWDPSGWEWMIRDWTVQAPQVQGD